MSSNPLKDVQGSPAPAPSASVDTSLNPNGGNHQKSATASIIGAVGAVVAAVIGAFSQNRANERNIDLMHEQNQWNLDQWNRENAYNLPTSQMARLKAAGLNPAIMYGNGGIMNESAASQPAADAPNVRPELQIDPLTASQVQLNEAQAKSIEHQTQREDEKQPITLGQMQADLEQCKAKTDEILQAINNLKFDEQLKSIEYLRSSLDYQFHSATFNDAVQQFRTGLESAKLDVDLKKFDLSRSMQILTYELLGWDLKNRRERALLNIDLQTYRQTETLFQYVEKKYKWDAENARYRSGLTKNEVTLKGLEFWINARNNVHAIEAFDSWNNSHYADYIWGDKFSQFMSGVSDVWNHGLDIPLRLGK